MKIAASEPDTPRIRRKRKNRSGLPQFVSKETSRHGATVYYFRQNKGPRMRMPAPGSPEFAKAYAGVMAGDRAAIAEVIPLHWLYPEAKNQKLIIKTVRNATRKARERAGRKGVPFDLTPEWAEQEVRRQGFRCVLSGVPFFLEKVRRSKHHPYMPSLDRIEPKKGYVIGNVRIVTFAVNIMLMDWGEEVFHRTILSYMHKRRLKLPPLELDQPPNLRCGDRRSGFVL